MSRISPSEMLDKELRALLWDGINGAESGNILSVLMRQATAKVIQEALESELTQFLGRERYERYRSDDETQQKPLRNGYKERTLRTAEGPIKIQLPQVRNTTEPYQSTLWQFLKGNSDVLQWLVVEMYARGLSMRDIEDAFTDKDGNCLISKSQASELTDSLRQDYEAFARRDLSDFEVVYLFVDAVYEPMRRVGRTKEAIFSCWAILSTGERVLIHMDVGVSESYVSWKSFLTDMVRRGLRTPVTITTDGAPGLTRAVEETWSQSMRIRCWFHKLQNVLAKVPDEAQKEVKDFLWSIRDAPDWATGMQLAGQFIDKYEGIYSRAVSSFQDDMEASLAHLYLPPIHRVHVRTTNLIERTFVEQRRRTKVIPRFMSEESALKLTFATIWRVSQRWSRTRFSEHERSQIDKLKVRLGLVSPTEPTSTPSAEVLAG